jgi:GAF domain-containing protein
VSKDPRYLTTLETTKAEMIMPVLRDGRVVGTIDVESDRAGAFTDEDRVFLETCTAVVLPLWSD